MRRTLGLASLVWPALLTTAGASCSPLPPDCPDRLLCNEAAASGDGDMPFPPVPIVDTESSGAACVPSGDGSTIPGGCGVFVRASGNDDNPGSKSEPVATLARAIALAAKGARRVYACAETFPEVLSLTEPVDLYGGLACEEGWILDGTAPTTLAPPKGVPLRMIETASGTKVSDFAIVAPDASLAGESSIAVIADGVRASLLRCALTAGQGADGPPGASAGAIPAPPGVDGKAGGATCSDIIVEGGSGGVNVCGAVTSNGGNGGPGLSIVGGAGSEGLPGLGQGAAGNGDNGGTKWTCAVNGGDGREGARGEDGVPGEGASGLGAISAAGYQGVNGGDGYAGASGQGGGGGGGRAGIGACSAGKGGASGGGGGAGGCGGKGGGGGVAGGASIALISLKATLTLTGVTIRTGDGGRGGSGGDPQIGGVGGFGGVGGIGGKSGCHGGRGGRGGDGGFGGGGQGGHSVGVAYTGARPMIDDDVISIGAAGDGGLSIVNAGEGGIAVKAQQFD